MTPQFPLYIVSKGRADSRLTVKALDLMGVDYRVIVEPQEFDTYAAVIPEARLLPLDMAYKAAYDTCEADDDTKSTGSGPARNFAWDHSLTAGFTHHWVMDDNIRDFYRLNRNQLLRMHAPVFFRIMEDFMLRYRNVAMGGPQYNMFVPRKVRKAPVTFNTRIYSCNLIRNDMPFRWRGRYNEDTILSLDMLKAGWCTVMFNALLQNKQWTQSTKGGNTTEIYGDGTMPKSQMLCNLHPDVARITWKFGRWHHEVDYSGFQKRNRLIKRDDAEIPEGHPEYGMVINSSAPGHLQKYRDLGLPVAE